MAQKLKVTPKQILIAVAVIVLVIWVATCQWRAAEERRRDEEIATAEGLAQVVSTTFAGRTDLKVSNVSGTIDVTSVDRGTIFASELKATLPYSVDYFVDLSGLGTEDARYDPASRTLVVEIPDVRIAQPNIDLTKGRVGQAEGFWVSRRASANLVNRALRLTNEKANQNARKPEYVERARQEARNRIGALLETPLKAAGFENVKVVARFAGEEDGADPSYIDLSTPYNEAIEGAASKGRSGTVDDRSNAKPERARPPRRDRAAEARAQRRDPRALLSEAGDPGPRGLRWRQPRSISQSRRDGCRRHCLLRRPLHGRDGEDTVSTERR